MTRYMTYNCIATKSFTVQAHKNLLYSLRQKGQPIPMWVLRPHYKIVLILDKILLRLEKGLLSQHLSIWPLMCHNMLRRRNVFSMNSLSRRSCCSALLVRCKSLWRVSRFSCIGTPFTTISMKGRSFQAWFVAVPRLFCNTCCPFLLCTSQLKLDANGRWMKRTQQTALRR